MQDYKSMRSCHVHQQLCGSLKHYSKSTFNTKRARPSPSSTTHKDLSTWLYHTQRTALTPQSTVHVGTSYEYLCAQTLPRLGFTDLLRTGGRSDRGIDLLGHWKFPSLGPGDKTIPVIIQCKATARKPGPDIIRELEGAIAGARGDWNNEATIGILCAKREATGGVREAVKRSRRGVLWVMLEDLGADGEGPGGYGGRGRVKQILWNETVENVIGLRTGAGLRYVPGDRGMEKETCLTLDGKVWEPELS